MKKFNKRIIGSRSDRIATHIFDPVTPTAFGLVWNLLLVIHA